MWSPKLVPTFLLATTLSATVVRVQVAAICSQRWQSEHDRHSTFLMTDTPNVWWQTLQMSGGKGSDWDEDSVEAIILRQIYHRRDRRIQHNIYVAPSMKWIETSSLIKYLKSQMDGSRYIPLHGWTEQMNRTNWLTWWNSQSRCSHPALILSTL